MSSCIYWSSMFITRTAFFNRVWESGIAILTVIVWPRMIFCVIFFKLVLKLCMDLKKFRIKTCGLMQLYTGTLKCLYIEVPCTVIIIIVHVFAKMQKLINYSCQSTMIQTTWHSIIIPATVLLAESSSAVMNFVSFKLSGFGFKARFSSFSSCMWYYNHYQEYITYIVITNLNMTVTLQPGFAMIIISETVSTLLNKQYNCCAD